MESCRLFEPDAEQLLERLLCRPVRADVPRREAAVGVAHALLRAHRASVLVRRDEPEAQRVRHESGNRRVDSEQQTVFRARAEETVGLLEALRRVTRPSKAAPSTSLPCAEFPPAETPLWAVLVGLLVSMSVGIFFGLYPAVK